LTVNGHNRDASYGDVIFVSIGAGAAYYVGEGNYVLSGSLSLARLAFEGFDIQRSQNSTDRGPSFRALFGKEWWVSSNWGMGVVLALTFSSVKDKHLVAANANGDAATWSTGAISLLYSATYN
jgi:hypothetical protein